MKTAMYALGRLKAGTMNKTEAAYDQHLALLQHAGQILWRRFEGLKLRLADNTFYTPDFAVMAADGVIECHEVKGYWQDDARAKIKIAAAQYPFRFLAVIARTQKQGGGWDMEIF
ncbi:DUF1064 domain-containing protein [Comamonas terrigena]|uniref:DUF1064 domain-containing protein n=1 Tax=Comamonas terrigena TaxID=32013 RepID=UPI002896ADFD|nr:DUF1064 domain-containing protein [Comamonas terrigena]